MRVLVTRPAAQAAEWVATLQENGIDALSLPLIGIEPASDVAALHDAWRGIQQRRLVVFVSPNAAQQFMARKFAAQQPAGLPWPANVLAGSPGPGTTRTLLDAGVPASCIVEPAADAPQFDSEALWAQLARRDWQGADVLIVRGDGGRDWLAETLRARGATVAHLQAYRRVAPSFDAGATALLGDALAQPAAHLWFFSSSEAVANLGAVVAGLGASANPAGPWLRARAVATHPRIAERASQLGFGCVAEARPTLAAVVACIQSMRP